MAVTLNERIKDFCSSNEHTDAVWKCLIASGEGVGYLAENTPIGKLAETLVGSFKDLRSLNALFMIPKICIENGKYVSEFSCKPEKLWDGSKKVVFTILMVVSIPGIFFTKRCVQSGLFPSLCGRVNTILIKSVDGISLVHDTLDLFIQVVWAKANQKEGYKAVLDQDGPNRLGHAVRLIKVFEGLLKVLGIKGMGVFGKPVMLSIAMTSASAALFQKSWKHFTK